MHHNKTPTTAIGQGIHREDCLDALLSITGRMDGFLYRCRNDPSYTMLYISDGILTLSGFPPADFIHNRAREYVSVIHPDDLTLVYSAVDTALAARTNWNVDYRIVPLLGPPIWVREIGGGVLNESGELEFLEGFVIDISDRKVIEDLNDGLLRELKAANEGLSAQKLALEVAKQQSDHSANHDLLTGLPNRRAFHKRLNDTIDRSKRTGAAAGLLFIDMDRFKEVNDTLGHEAGDALLQNVSDRLRKILRSGDFVARLGGDEFGFLFTASIDQTQENAVRVAKRIVERLRIAVPSPNGSIRVGCTVGVAVCPTDASDSQALLTLADQLMYRGKRSGRGRFVTTTELKRAS